MSNHARKQKRRASRPALQLTGESGAAMDRACALDRAFFEANPTEQTYLRRPVPGEFPGVWSFRETERIQVTQIRPGVRNRRVVEVQSPSRN